MLDSVSQALSTAQHIIPSDAQKSAGNYKKHHLTWQGLNIALENLKGSERKSCDRFGKAWSVKMPAHYGYFKKTEGKDGDHVDCYVGPDLNSKRVFIINQNDLNGKFDEHKCMIGFRDLVSARKAYVAGFSDGKGNQRIGSVKDFGIEAFKDWLSDALKTKRIARASGGKVS